MSQHRPHSGRVPMGQYGAPTPPPAPRRRPHVALIASVAAAALIAGGGVAVFLTRDSGPSGDASTAAGVTAGALAAPNRPKSTAEPRTEAGARAASQRAWTAYAAGDYAAVWDTFTAADRKRISRAEYTRVVQACLGTGIGFTPRIVASRPEGNDYVVTVDAGIGTTARTWTYEGGRWHENMTAELRAELADGPDAFLATLRESGACTE